MAPSGAELEIFARGHRGGKGILGGTQLKKSTLDWNNQDACQRKLQIALSRLFQERDKVF